MVGVEEAYAGMCAGRSLDACCEASRADSQERSIAGIMQVHTDGLPHPEAQPGGGVGDFEMEKAVQALSTGSSNPLHLVKTCEFESCKPCKQLSESCEDIA